MYEHGYWADCAEAAELAIEGNRLIASEISEGIRSVWHRVVHWLDDSLHGLGQRRHLPPI